MVVVAGVEGFLHLAVVVVVELQAATKRDRTDKEGEGVSGLTFVR